MIQLAEFKNVQYKRDVPGVQITCSSFVHSRLRWFLIVNKLPLFPYLSFCLGMFII